MKVIEIEIRFDIEKTFVRFKIAAGQNIISAYKTFDKKPLWEINNFCQDQKQEIENATKNISFDEDEWQQVDLKKQLMSGREAMSSSVAGST